MRAASIRMAKEQALMILLFSLWISAMFFPALMPEEGSTSSTRFYSPHQSLGARGVNNLASKLLLALIPQQSSFFRLQIDEQALEELTGQEGLRGQIEEALSRIERTALSALEASSIRTMGFEAFKHLLVAGNVLMDMTSTDNPRAIRMDKYVLRRAPGPVAAGR